MTAERQQFSIALGLSAAVNVSLFLFIAWAMAVNRGLSGTTHLPPQPVQKDIVPPDVVTLVLSPETPAEAKQDPSSRQFINSPDDLPETTPRESTRFISSRNMRAASAEAPSPEGSEGLMTQQGLDKPFLDLRDSDFKDGSESPPAPPALTATSEPGPPEPPTPSSLQRPPDFPSPDPVEEPLDTPPEPSPGASPPRSPSPQVEAQPEPQEPDSEPEPNSAPVFLDPEAPNLIPPPALPPLPNSIPPPPVQASRPPVPLTRIPDRVPEPEYAPGTRKSQQLGKISNRGPAALDAAATAEGRFGKSIRTAIEKTWRRRMLKLAGLANPGLVEVEFEVDPKGRISNVRLANPGEANPVMQDCALSAVIEAKLPPPPPELFEELRDNLSGGRMRCSISFLIY